MEVKWKMMTMVKLIVSILMFCILQWNSRSLIANGQKLKKFVDGLKNKPQLICIQETWLKASLDFVMPSFICLRKDRNSTGGGCAIFVKKGVQYKQVNITSGLECLAIEVWSTAGRFSLVNFYNPCLRLEMDKLDDIMDQVRPPVVWTGDFNAHNPILGSRIRDGNGVLIEDFIDKNNLVVLNDGRPTRIQVNSGSLSCIDLTFASGELVRCGKWYPMDLNTLGSDHFPIFSEFGSALQVEKERVERGFNFLKADWDKFRDQLVRSLGDVNSQGSTDEWSISFCGVVRKAAGKAIRMKGERKERKSVPWWNQACDEAVWVRNRAHRQLRRCPVESLVVEYKQRRAEARKVIKCAKRESWQKFCGTLGSETTVKQVWNMIHCMAGINRGFSIPVLVEGGREVVSNKDKADLLVRSFQQVHSDKNVGRDGLIRRELMLKQEGYKLNKNNDNSYVINLFFSLHELRRAIRRGRHTTPGRDELGYEIFQHMDDFALEEVLALINTVWGEGSIPA